ncbi:hypothetical protein [Chryseobacterium sp. MFBS3-17]|uniref:hypothetical protein n=1 Tax=Chryseobacterium sp. MFBS3-17 TaxID=2886689 RepID=UPI001D0EBC70|nr:hypothetical protein [Chryseobacterium sp. MFBS3-17]MCC2590088.1 hypothetical protein [Chryseobacterium sp. MFBS3-17]
MLLGLERTSRRVSLEMGTLINKPLKWRSLLDIHSMLNDKKYNIFIFQDELDSKLEKGNYVLISEERIPWAWAKNFNDPRQKYYKFIIK